VAWAKQNTGTSQMEYLTDWRSHIFVDRERPLVSVIIPTHNRPDLLRQALESVRAQTFRDFEIIVVSSNEGAEARARTLETCSAFEGRFFTCDHGHVASAGNVGLDAARGVWVAFLDDDDLWFPDKIARQLAAAEMFGADMVTCDYSEFNEGGIVAIRRHRLCGKTWTGATSYSSWWTTPSATLIKTAALREVGGFCEWLRYGEDNDLWRRLSWRHKIHQMAVVLVRYRHGNAHASMTQSRVMMKVWHLIHLLKMRFDTPKHLRKDLPPWSIIVWQMMDIARRNRKIYRAWRVFNVFTGNLPSRVLGRVKAVIEPW
jgi:glycosyltransferase involved in cell wall biosynthesis